MDLIDRYLAAVRRHLPRDQQDDIVEELADNLRSELEELEQAAGHPLSANEQAEVLKKHGHPWVMAARYAPQQYLIGPALFPYYKQTLILVLFWVVLPITVFSALLSGFTGLSARGWPALMSTAWNGIIYTIGIVTSVFYVLERERVRITTLDNWDPQRLPEFQSGRAVPRSETVAGFVFGLIFLMWWSGLVRVPDLVFYDGQAVTLEPAAIWQFMYWPVLVLATASLLISVIDFIRPWRTLAVSCADMTINLANVALLVYVIQLRPQFFEVLGDPAHADQIARIARFVNGGMTWSLMIVAAVILFDTLYELWQVTRARTAAIRFV